MLPLLTTAQKLSVLTVTFACVYSKKLPDVQWSSRNHQFNIPGGYYLSADENDTIDFVCPGRSESGTARAPYEESVLVYRVPVLNYETCQLDDFVKLFLKCDQSGASLRKKIVLRSFSPTPDVTTFTPGSSYYFIVTSDGRTSGIHNTRGGLCVSHNMRFRLDFAHKGRTTAVPDADIDYLVHEFESGYFADNTVPSKRGSNHAPEDFTVERISLASEEEFAKRYNIDVSYLHYIREKAVRGDLRPLRPLRMTSDSTPQSSDALASTAPRDSLESGLNINSRVVYIGNGPPREDRKETKTANATDGASNYRCCLFVMLITWLVLFCLTLSWHWSPP